MVGLRGEWGLFHTLRSVEVKAAEKCPAERRGRKMEGRKMEVAAVGRTHGEKIGTAITSFT